MQTRSTTLGSIGVGLGFATGLAWLALGLGPAACGPEESGNHPQPENPEEVVLSLDGLEFRRGEIEEYWPYFHAMDPSLGHNTVRRETLEQYLLPLKFAQAQFAAERQVQRQRAEALARLLGSEGGYEELKELSQQNPNAEILEGLVRDELSFPERAWAFSELNVGRASQVLETPQGFAILAASDLRRGATTAYDRVDVLTVRFFTMRAKGYGRWWQSTKEMVAKKPVQVHIDYQTALPPWLRP